MPPPRHPLKNNNSPQTTHMWLALSICLDCYDQWMVAMAFSDIFLHKKESFADRWHVPRCVGTGRPSQIVSVSRAGWKPEVGVSSPGTTVSPSPLPTPQLLSSTPLTPPMLLFFSRQNPAVTSALVVGVVVPCSMILPCACCELTWCVVVLSVKWSHQHLSEK